MSLKEYKKKRDFKKTPEPAGTQTKRAGNAFVIQKHAASRLHYDFRLELDGVLKSWAVPKGPSYDPAEKRLAVHVEDHPVEYGEFEGIIPEGQYGGGTVMLWDHGTWESIDGDPAKKYKEGKLKIYLHGEKLRGGWALVRMGGKANEDGKNWLLIKERDDAAQKEKKYSITKAEPNSVTTGRSIEEIAQDADLEWESNRPSNGKKKPKAKQRNASTKKTTRKAAALPDPAELSKAKKKKPPGAFKPQLATLRKEIPTGDDWLHEIKYDGYRILCRIDTGKVRLVTRNGKVWTEKFKPVADAVAAMGVDDTVIDGEAVVLRANGSTDFQALQNILRGDRKSKNLVFYAFDLPFYQGYDLTRLPLRDRKEALKQLLDAAGDGKVLRYSDHIAGKGPAVYGQTCAHGLEGVISKKADATYEQKRTRTWVKTKCLRRQEFVIGGYSPPAGTRKHFGALLLGYHKNGALHYCGKVGTGFNEKSLKEIFDALQPLRRKTAPFENPPKGREAKGVHWVSPQLLAEVNFTEWTEEDILRHPSFQGLREDKDAKQVVREDVPDTPPKPRKKSSGKPEAAMKSIDKSTEKLAKKSGGSKKAGTSKKAGDTTSVAGVRLTNPDRLMYPDLGLTKLELAQFYVDIADWVLPHVIHRPLSVVRCPQGRQAKCFYQKHTAETLPPAVRGVPVKEKGGTGEYIAIDNLEGLISLVQVGVLEIHPWGSRDDDVEKPDLLTFDLDPDPSVGYERVVEGAFDLRHRFAAMGLESFVKTSGGKGLHIVVPIMRRSSWDEAKEFAKAVAVTMSKEQPEKYLANMSKAKRKGKIFVDYLRNGRGATSVAAYSTRAKANAPVSTPICWEELSPKLAPDAFRVENLRNRLARLKSDPWADYFNTRQSITKNALKSVGLA